MNRRMIGAALALSLLGGTSALAQHDQRDQRDQGTGGGGGPDAQHVHRQGLPPSGPPAAGPQGAGGPGPGGGRELHHGPLAPVGPQGGPGEPHPGFTGAPHPGFTGAPDRRGEGDPRWQGHDQRFQGGDRGWQGGDQRFQGGDQRGRDGGDRRFDQREGDRPRYDRREFPSEIRADRRYHWRGPQWYPPAGFYYRHWGYGERLPWGWFEPRWYIDDYYDYDLPLPPYGYEWIRVGPDALLVDIRTGIVVESDYGLFW